MGGGLPEQYHPLPSNTRDQGQRPTMQSQWWSQLRCGGAAVYFSDNTGFLVHETSPFPRTQARCDHRSWVKNGQKVRLLRPMVSVSDDEGQGAPSLFC